MDIWILTDAEDNAILAVCATHELAQEFAVSDQGVNASISWGERIDTNTWTAGSRTRTVGYTIRRYEVATHREGE